MSYFNMNARITIGQLVITSPNSFEINEDLNKSSDTAVITLARNYKHLTDKSILEYIKDGLPVKIECGYNGELHTEFKGYTNFEFLGEDAPVIINCSEFSPSLRNEKLNISELNITLRNLLQRIAPNYNIDCINVNLGKVRFNRCTAVEIIEQIHKDFGFVTRIDDNVLSTGFTFDYKPKITKNVIYKVGKNIKDASGLKYKPKEDVKVIVKYSNGKKVEYGSNSSSAPVKNIKLNDNVPLEDAHKIAQSIYGKYYDVGFQGSIKCFGLPITHAGDSVDFMDQPRFAYRNGRYLVERVKLTFEEAHIEREIFLTSKMIL